jgi:hypothetical protein
MLAEEDKNRGQFSAINTHTAQSGDSCAVRPPIEVCVFKRYHITQRIYECWKERFAIIFPGQYTVTDEPPTNNFAIIIVDQHLSFESVLDLQAWLHGYDPAVIVSERWPIECLKARVLQPTDNFARVYNFP